MSKDQIPESLWEGVTLANELIQSSYLLAARIALFQELYPDRSLPYGIHEEIQTLNEQVDEVADLDITFSGVGCVPALMPDGDVDSIYGIADLYTGTIESFDLCEPTDMLVIDDDDLEEYAEDDGSLLYDSQQLRSLRDRLVVPSSGLKLFTEFLLESESGGEVAGSAVRAPRIDHYAIIESHSLKITTMDTYTKPLCSTADEIAERLIDAAANMRNLLVNTKFRRQSRRSQARTLERQLERLNQELHIERFSVVARPNEIYVPDTSNENYRMVRMRVPKEIAAFTSQCIQIDSLEHFMLTNTMQRITRNSAMRDPEGSFCVVGEIDTQTQRQLGTPSKIVWLPVRPLGKSKRNRPGYVDPLFDGIFIDSM